MTDVNIFSDPILITGGAGFLGSHMVAYCLEKGVDVVVIDNLCNSDLTNLQKLALYFKLTIPFYNIDIRDKDMLMQFFKGKKFSAVIHFAGLKSVAESVANPDFYFENNVTGSQNLIYCIKEHRIENIIFSSSASVYGDPNYLPIDEAHSVQPINPYGETKAQVEQLFLKDEYFNKRTVKLLRYFNPVGSYKGIIGERSNGVPSNLMPFILGVARGDYDYLNIYGEDYLTKDGTGVRDYIHVMDLIEAHWLSLMDYTLGCEIYNIGCGKGFSVKEIVQSFEKTNGVKIPYQIQSRRSGDTAICYAAVDKIKKKFNWSAQLSIEDICRDVWSTSSS